MFDSYFPYRQINHQIDEEGTISYNYSFVGRSGRRYIAVVEQFNHRIYVPKFYLQIHKSCKHKYNRNTGLNEFKPVMGTMIRIILDTYHKDPYASFAFIGNNSIGEDRANTQRFRIYSKAMYDQISPVKFDHYDHKVKSAYLLANKDNTSMPDRKSVEEYFEEIYDFESGEMKRVSVYGTSKKVKINR